MLNAHTDEIKKEDIDTEIGGDIDQAPPKRGVQNANSVSLQCRDLLRKKIHISESHLFNTYFEAQPMS